MMKFLQQLFNLFLRLTDQEVEDIIMGGRLWDAHINGAQKFLNVIFSTLMD